MDDGSSVDQFFVTGFLSALLQRGATVFCSCRICWMKMMWKWQLMPWKNSKRWCLVQTGRASRGAATIGGCLVCLGGKILAAVSAWAGNPLQRCNFCLIGPRKGRGAGAVAGTGSEGTDLAPGLVPGLGIGTEENPDTGQGAEVGVPVRTERIGKSTLKRAMRGGETST